MRLQREKEFLDRIHAPQRGLRGMHRTQSANWAGIARPRSSRQNRCLADRESQKFQNDFSGRPASQSRLFRPQSSHVLPSRALARSNGLYRAAVRGRILLRSDRGGPLRNSRSDSPDDDPPISTSSGAMRQSRRYCGRRLCCMSRNGSTARLCGSLGVKVVLKANTQGRILSWSSWSVPTPSPVRQPR